jgi:acetyltransferase-like isoleucine patch superfamily enzyme
MSHQIQCITIEGGTALGEGVVLEACGENTGEKLIIRKGTYINRHTIVNAHGRVDIGQGCMIGPFCYITDGNHGMAADAPVRKQPMVVKPVVFEEDVWLGAHVTVLPGVRLGKGCVIGAGAVVNTDIPAGAIAAGIPARVIKYRQPPTAG